MITDGFTYVAVLLFMADVLVAMENTAKGALKAFFSMSPLSCCAI